MNLAQTLNQQALPSVPNIVPTVFVIDEDAHSRKALELLIRSQGWRSETFESAEDVLATEEPAVPSCLVLALSTHSSRGMELQKRIAREWPATPIVVISGLEDIPTTVEAMKAGAADFLVKPLRNEALVLTVAQCLERSRAALEREIRLRSLRKRFATLSLREGQVMKLVVAGLLNKQVGWELGISEITVKAHRGQVMHKMEANSFADLVRMASAIQGSQLAIHFA
jgi:FixJ family two-component response regulator